MKRACIFHRWHDSFWAKKLNFLSWFTNLSQVQILYTCKKGRKNFPLLFTILNNWKQIQVCILSYTYEDWQQCNEKKNYFQNLAWKTILEIYVFFQMAWIRQVKELKHTQVSKVKYRNEAGSCKQFNAWIIAKKNAWRLECPQTLFVCFYGLETFQQFSDIKHVLSITHFRTRKKIINDSLNAMTKGKQ